MSVEAKGDSPSLNKDDDASAASIQSGIPKNSLETEAGISTPKGDGANVLTFMGEELEPFDDDVEAVIEKKLKFDKDKGLDVDSELDFELKWDDDADNTNDDQGKVKTDAKVDPELDFDEGESKTDKDPSKTKTNITVVDNVSAETSNNEQKPTEQENNDNPKVIQKPIDILDEVNVKASENEAVSEENKGMDACNAENKVFLIDTNKKIDLESKTSSSASENSSLDERLVYSDVEVPDIEDKELMDELDAQICETDPNLGKGLEGDIVTSKTLVESESSPKECVDAGSSQQILSSPMDVDEVTKLDSEKENDTSDPNDTILSSNDLETSSYEINKEHKLKKPDVMLEIPTQEFIESFGDSEMSDEALEYDEDILLNNDATNNDLILIEGELPTNIETIDNLPKSIEVNDNNKDKMETVFDDRKIETDTVVNEQQDILKMEGNELEAKTSEMMEKVLLESNSDNDKSESKEVIRCDDNEIELMDVDAENEESHADIILEASHLEPNLTRKIEDISHKADVEPTDTLKAESIILPVAIATKYDTDVIKVSLPGHIEPQVSTLVDVEPEVATEQKETLYSADFEAKLLPEPMEIISTADTEPKVSVNATEAISASEVPTDVAVAKEIISTPDLLPKEDTKVAESNADEANLEKITVVKEVISTSDTPPLEEMETTYAVGQEVATEVAEIKEVTSDEASSKEVMAVEEVSLDALPEVVKEVDTTNAGIEPAMAIEATEVKEAASDEETPIKVPVVGVVSPIDAPLEVVKEVETTNTEAEPEVAKVVEEVAVADLQTKEVTEKEVVPKDAAQPSTSKYMQESSDEDQEVTDSLGLLAESSRVMDDDDEHEQDDEDDDDDFDQDDESNQMTAEHSEDSNAHQSETEVKETIEVEEAAADKELQFQIAEVLSVADAEEAENEVTESREAIDDTEVETAVKSLLEIEDSKSNEETVASVTEATESATDDTDKLSDEPVNDEEAEGAASKLRELLTKDKADSAETVEPDKTSPSKTKKLEIAKPKNEINIVELEESSSEDDIQEVAKPSEAEEVTSVNIPLEVEVMSASAGAPSDMRRAEGEVVISGVPRPPPQKPARLNTGEVTIKTTAATTESLVIPETKISTSAAQDKPVLGLEIFSLDSDDDEKESAPKQLTAVEIDAARATSRCINVQCKSGLDPGPAGPAAVAYYGGRRGQVCRRCDMNVTSRGLSLIEGIKDFSPLLSLDMGQIREELVEISDSDSEEEISAAKMAEDAIGTKEADFLEEQLAAMFNRTWKKYGMDARLKAAESEISDEVSKLEEECTKINTMLNECQVATDKLRNDLYDTFAGERDELAPIMIYDTPTNTWCGLEEGIIQCENKETRQSKRRSSVAEPPAKRAAIPLGYAPLNSDANRAQNESRAASSTTDIAMQNDDDNCDISVVKLSAEAAPADLPPPGTASRPPLRAQMPVYAMRNAFGSWSKARILDVQPKVNGQFTMCRVKFEHKVKNPTKVLQARCLAYEHPSDVRMTIGTRLVALFKDNDNKRESYYSGIVAEIPNPVNNYRYLVFFDDGYAQYVQHSATRLVCECAPLVWDEVHPFSRQFVREYLCSYPERPMVRVHAGQSIRTEYNGKWWDSKVLQVDASLVQVHFDKENRTEWVYRGSTRLAPLYWELQAAERQRARPLPRAQPGKRFNMPYVEYTRSDDPAPRAVPSPAQIEQDIRRQRAVAKKSTSAPAQQPAPASLDGIASRVVFYTPKNAIKPNKMVPHTCSPKCKRTDVLALKDLRTYNPLTKPLLSGWERQIVKYKWSRSVMYRAPCGRRLRSQAELHRYLQLTGSDMPVDLFDFGPNTHCLAEFVLTKCRVSKKDLSHGKENVPVPCVNYYDDSLPEFCSYNTERTPTAGVPLNLDPEFLCGCDCTDDCADKSKCACWKMTLEGARTIGLHSDEVGYVYKRLPEPLPSGIYECNSRCKCRQTCLNRVAQHPLQLKLQVFKTLNRGWGIRALNDIPKGAFLCVYAGNLLTDATANLDGLNEGDEYLAELDYIEVVEQMKEGFEEDIPDADKKLDKKSSDQDDSTSTTSSSEEEEDPRNNADDDDFRPTLPLAHAPTEYTKRLRKRERTKKKEDVKEEKQKERDPNSEDTCITISDDEELREPARFAAQAGMGDKGFVSKYKSVRAHFGKDEACYIMDAKVQGNIGRYLNHSCTPNVFVQNVFVDTHDPRFPWVAFFALSHIRAGTELTWNYNYDVGSVPGKVLYCHCAAPNCRGRLL